MVHERPAGMVDGHVSAYYGKKGNESFTIKSRSMDGTAAFDAFLASAVRAGTYALRTGICRMRRGAKPEAYIQDILAQNREAGIKCSHRLVDRMFFSVAAMREFGKADEYFLMYARMTPGIKKALNEYIAGRRAAVSEYIVKPDGAKFVGTLAFVHKVKMERDSTKEEVSLPLFSNLPRGRLKRALEDLPPEIKKRRVHETAFRVAKMSKPMATSNSPPLRTFLFWSSRLNSSLRAMTDYDHEVKRRAEEGMPPLKLPPPSGDIGAPRRRVPKNKYSLTSKEFLRMSCRRRLG